MAITTNETGEITLYNLQEGRKVAVLTIDPTSPMSGGSILGDKTRMPQLSEHVDAMVRPSPSGRFNGGIGNNTRDQMLVCEAAGFDVVIVETVGSGQGETAIESISDILLLLLQPPSQLPPAVLTVPLGNTLG